MKPVLLILAAAGAACVLALDWLLRPKAGGLLDRPTPGSWLPPNPVPAPPPPPPPPRPGGDSFVAATAALDSVLAYLRATDRYGADEAAAARVLRAATVEAATPSVPPPALPPVEAVA